jgi:superfamily II DNA helicase RecQ
VELENALLENRVKALVATTALGMGFDKPDLAFVIHYQTPGSVVAYYQQVGRAGRALKAAHGVLLSGAEETDITDFFIESAFPSREEVAGSAGCAARRAGRAFHPAVNAVGERTTRSDRQGSATDGAGIASSDREGRQQVAAHRNQLDGGVLAAGRPPDCATPG